MKATKSSLLALTLLSILFFQCRHDKKDTLGSSETSNWIPFNPTHQLMEPGSALDVSFLLDAPAGNHGFVQAVGDRFLFEDGTEARFWGGNIFGEANFPNKENAEIIAERIAQAGANIVRMHHIDVVTPWTDKVVHRSLFGGLDAQTTRKLDSVNLDRFEYLIHCFKKKGIYVFLSHISSRKIKPLDEFPGPDDAIIETSLGFKLSGMFDPFLIDLQKEYLTQLLTHVNPYTGLALKDDPVMAIMEINNENTLFRHDDSPYWGIQTEYYKSMFDSIFNKWLKSKYKTHNDLLASWKDEKGKVHILDGEDLDKSNITYQLYPSVNGEYNDKYKAFGNQQRKDYVNFLYDTQKEYHDDMYSFLKDLGVKTPIAANNNWLTQFPLAHLLAHYDYTDAHNYYSHPHSVYNFVDSVSISDTRAMVKNFSKGVIQQSVTKRLHNQPYTISEWNSCAPNVYRAEASPMVAAFSAFQNWNSIQFAYYGSRLVKYDTINVFETMFDPAFVNTYPAAALIFHRKDVREATKAYYDILEKDEYNDFFRDKNRNFEVAFTNKFGIAFSDLEVPKNDPEILKKAKSQGRSFVNEHEEIFWDFDKGILQLNTDRTQGVIGFAKGEPIALKSTSIEMTSDFGVILVSSLTNEPIASSKRILITLSADARLKGSVFNDDRTLLSTCGTFPFLMQPVEGVVKINRKDALKVFKLSQNGKRLSEVNNSNTKDGIKLELSSKDGAMHYEIVAE